MRARNIISEHLRGTLLENPKGMTVYDLAKATGYSQDKVIGCLQRHYEFYIARYIRNPEGRLYFNAVWCCVQVPKNAKKPSSAALIVDELKALAEKRRLNKQDKKRQERLLQKRANDKIRAAAKAEKERLKQLKAASPEYVPEKTMWVKVPSWSEAATI